MTLTLLLVILLIGLLLISIEVFLVTGTTIVGVIGLLVLGVGVYFSFDLYGATTGGAVLVGSGLIIGILTAIGLKRLDNSSFNVKARIDGRVNEFDYSGISVGDEGVTVTALRPEGKAMIGEELLTVHSKGFYIDTNVEIKVIRIKDNKIFVETKS